ncbi:copper amine oxidase [Dacryopinax primogenitus]|uniref:Amine oxidase n=1 Tax=Dacryopinax primogenitus (strain DJM 731) TaxID=1858805 RepID=M5FQR4_DACPD|nr:copper amine oxidase [Dacryopinax primogenitus]EJT99280.1 copper amine oxidase [Dacryopinax primogenitus]
MAELHPFDPLTPAEIQNTVAVLKAQFPDVPLRFKVIEILEPTKSDVIPFIEAERLGKPLPAYPTRLTFSYFHRMDTGIFHKAVLNPSGGKVISMKQLPGTIQGPIDVDEMIAIEKFCLQHPAVLAEIEKMKLPSGYSVCTDPWIYGTDDENESRRLIQCYMYVVDRDHPECNHYSIPATFSPVFDAVKLELVRMDYLPPGNTFEGVPTSPWKPVKAVQYAHALMDEPVRTDLKPYIVQQPEGPSFTVSNNNLIQWQKWRFRIGFNYRDGLVIYNVTYAGRNVFYRLSMCEMTVPYGDPRAPYHRKQAFDVGDVGLGVTANQLALGCDCLGHIKYFDGYRTDSKGNPVHLKNVICLHEQDGGLLHKHTNYRSGIATVARNRQLVVQMIATVANYEYIFAWIFDQAAGIDFEVRATGILSTIPMDTEDGQTSEWGPNIAPGVVGSYHQHLFSLRIDPAIDGFKNTVIYEDSVPSKPDPVKNNWGNSYVTEDTIIKEAGAYDTNVPLHRTYKIRNDSVINKLTHKPVSYKIMTCPSQMLLMAPDSYNTKRAGFATKPVWVTKYQDGELYAAGEFTNQSKKGTGVEVWTERKDHVENEDLVFWHTFGLTHNPRPEDFPVMPVERIMVSMKPNGFFEKSPALDVPQSVQSANKSTLYNGANGKITTDTASCCYPTPLPNGSHA